MLFSSQLNSISGTSSKWVLQNTKKPHEDILSSIKEPPAQVLFKAEQDVSFTYAPKSRTVQLATKTYKLVMGPMGLGT